MTTTTPPIGPRKMIKSSSLNEFAVLPTDKPYEGYNGYIGFTPGRTEILKKGSIRKGWNDLDGLPLPCDILVEHDVLIEVRDGTKLYGDIYRPVDESEKVPCILSWSPYGKKYSGHQMLRHVYWQCGVIPSDISGLEKFEGVDPAKFCDWGYAVASVDSRGAGHSEGYMELMGKQDAEDGHDVVEFLGHQPWCNGSVGMAGNSWLAIAQYFVAAERPPCLKAIAPWEGCGDIGREQFYRGGIFYISNFAWIAKHIMQGPAGVEDMETMYEKHPLFDSYWASKRAPMEKINIPVFLKGSDFASMHTMGSIRAWMEIPVKEKWMKWSGYQEWFDLWATPESAIELRMFFDRYLKGIENDIETKLPKCRWSLLRYGNEEPIKKIVIPDFPHPDTRYENMYLGPNQTLVTETPKEATSISYEGDSWTDHVEFNITFDKTARLMGIPKAYLHMSSPDHNDMNVYILLRKFDKKGHPLSHVCCPMERRQIKDFYQIPEKDLSQGIMYFSGPLGMLRASHRRIDRSRSTHENIPFHPHDGVEHITPGEIVELEIGIWAIGMQLEAGETLSIQISGHNPLNPELRELSKERPLHERNVGKHLVHFGGKYPSRIILPFVDIEV